MCLPQRRPTSLAYRAGPPGAATRPAPPSSDVRVRARRVMRRHLHLLVMTAILIGCGPAGREAAAPDPSILNPRIASPGMFGSGGQSQAPSLRPSIAPTTGPSMAPSSPVTTPCPAGSPAAVSGTLVRPKVDTLAAVATDSLRVRSEPGLEAGSEVLRRRLMRRDVAYVVAGPVSASCYEWYQVYVPDDPAKERDEVFGWVAAGSIEGEPWLVSGHHLCPEPPRTVSDLADLPSSVGLACFTGRLLTFVAWLGTYETCGMSEGWTIEPRWLGDTCAGNDYMWIADRRARSASDFGATRAGPRRHRAERLDTLRFPPRQSAEGVDPSQRRPGSSTTGLRGRATASPKGIWSRSPTTRPSCNVAPSS